MASTGSPVIRESSAVARRPRRSTRARGSAGFSIVELIIVLGVMMTVSAIAIPRLDSAINKSREARAVVELHNISVLVQGYAAGNNGIYPNSLADIDCDKLKDPWGHPYQYLNLTNPANTGSRMINQFAAPLNTYFDLYSLGKDAITTRSLDDPSTQDDIIYANDGSFVGSALDYK